ncbi:50S ribosomal protein L20 [Candidatus Microgenomates bacterium]|jgi:large subunit ribosomal protein L20|nr:MAG: 50S ribosomal protein L20 [Candidatus Microgenomates bacterium]
MRVKTGFSRKRAHKKVLKQAKGYRMTKRRLIKVAKEALLHAGVYAYAGRKQKKQEQRKLWITRINGALTDTGLSYSNFVKAMKDKNIELDRKVLAQIIKEDPEAFKKIVEEVKG